MHVSVCTFGCKPCNPTWPCRHFAWTVNRHHHHLDNSRPFSVTLPKDTIGHSAQIVEMFLLSLRIVPYNVAFCFYVVSLHCSRGRCPELKANVSIQYSVEKACPHNGKWQLRLYSACGPLTLRILVYSIYGTSDIRRQLSHFAHPLPTTAQSNV